MLGFASWFIFVGAHVDTLALEHGYPRQIDRIPCLKRLSRPRVHSGAGGAKPEVPAADRGLGELRVSDFRRGAAVAGGGEEDAGLAVGPPVEIVALVAGLVGVADFPLRPDDIILQRENIFGAA